MKGTVIKIIGERNARRVRRLSSIIISRIQNVYNWMLRRDSFDCMVPIKIYGDAESHVFYGYYDVSPFSADGKRMLAMKTMSSGKEPAGNEILDVGYFNLDDESKNFHKFGSTNTWCWQQGCRLQWYPNDSNTTVIYNCMVENDYGCMIQEIISGRIVNCISRPIYDVCRDGRYALSLNFARLQRLRPGYGYSCLYDHSQSDEEPEGDGIWVVDINERSSRLLLSIRDIGLIDRQESMNGAAHYINHLSFNPTGSRFMFLHLWVNGRQRRSRLMTCDVNAHNVHVLTNGNMVSHYCWLSKSELLAYTELNERERKWIIYCDMSSTKTVYGPGVLNSDGHPHFIPNSLDCVIDSYPDIMRRQKLFLYRNRTGKLQQLSSFTIPEKYHGEYRCDLHPRVDRFGRLVCVDAIHGGKRAMYVHELEKDYEDYL